ncbi:MAG: DeoR/GlpR transcriptional regulator [Ruminococcaceae bacterium]|nr:DeoR/GlpR transcriptional regulator [Oscillospiraceae bacterium]
MGTDNRKQTILDLLKKNGSIKVAELSTILDVSEVTVRNYLADMESKGLLSRVHGGAVSSYKPYYSMNLTQRLETNQTQKVEIAQKIAQMIEPNDTIMLNAGTTTLFTFRKFPVDYNLNIVTNSIAVALEASGNPNYNVVLIGGSVNTKYQFSYGSQAVAQLRNYHAEKLILSVDGVDIKRGFTTYYDKEVAVDRAMIEQSDMCIVAADHSKFRNNAFAKISELSVADRIVTDIVEDDAYFNEIRDLGIEII